MRDKRSREVPCAAFLVMSALIVLLSQHIAPAAVSAATRPTAGVQAVKSVVGAVVASPTLADDPRLELLDALLADLPATRWADRREISRVLEEQMLSAAGGAAGMTERLRLGQLVRADVLLLLDRPAAAPRADEEAPSVWMLTAVQSGTGLRLLRSPVELSDDPAQDVRDLSDLAAEALARHRGGVRHVVAVPPFESEDLSRVNDHLKAAFARVLAEALSDRPGVLAVELEEAHAIRAELARTEGPATVNRLRPVYVTGRYGHGDAGRVTVRIEWHGDGEAPHRVERTFGTHAEAANFLRDAAATPNLFSDAADPKPTDPSAEARRLANRARAFAAVGDWAEAVNLIEASLLLEERPDVHREAAGYLDRLWLQRRDSEPAGPRDRLGIRERDRRLASLQYRGWQRFIVWSRVTKVSVGSVRLHDYFALGRHDHSLGERVRQDILDVYAVKAARDERDAWVEALAYAGSAPFMYEFDRSSRAAQASGGPWSIWQWIRDTPQILQFSAQVAAVIGRMPSARANDFERLLGGTHGGLPDNAAARKAVAKFARLEHPEAKRAAREMQHWLDSGFPETRGRDPATIRIVVPTGKDKEPEVSDVTFTAEDPGPWRGQLAGWSVLDRAEGLDAMWTRLGSTTGALYLLRADNPAQEVAEFIIGPQLGDEGASAVAFDGRHLWFAPHARDGAMLAAVDVRTGRQYTLGPEDALPPDPIVDIAITPLGEGEVCFAVGFGEHVNRRAYVAVASLDEPGERPRVRLLHQATRTRTNDGRESIDLGYYPTFAATLRETDEGVPRVRVFIGRSGLKRPLMIDPTGEVPPQAVEVPHELGDVFVSDGRAFGYGGWGNRSGDVYEVAAGAEQARPLGMGTLIFSLVPHDGRLWSINDRGFLRVSSGVGESFVDLATRYPPAEMKGGFNQTVNLFSTSRYGLIYSSEVHGQFWGVRVPEETLPPRLLSQPPDRETTAAGHH